ncbi:DUF4360 domain-containing protein [Actinomadura rubrisoli]|uniref:DUF4360 domain-containing protein n=1 Tax=Actinomadura rubrisoli TaxID=2530368 RepID=A0A4R5BLP6_9ACTN|nr:DUF4360 domain-containing protein [Actinomadura rubrisoli]TDD86805.1 DUF4360 domain-containing protein [Actinomadura rubrisoli]
MINVKRTAIVLAGALCVPVLTALPSAAAPVPPDNVSVDVVSVDGSGCPAGTSSVAISNDKTSFTVSYSDFLVYASGNAPPAASRKNCHMTVRVNAPDRWTYSVSGVDHQGFAGLESGASAVEWTDIYFLGGPQNEPIGGVLKGQYLNEWIFFDRVSPRRMTWKPCGDDRDLNINTELRLDAGSSDDDKMSFVSMGSTHGSASSLFTWRYCP